ncbi:hypothetical protein [Pedobacter mucosus]|uniref:hypothetical protein n=1 Tax=Pedobacter mucosus TaxID=2895286 RepID=UPI001EE3A335|nr:hypothetical protein [Pedobacter mucosus]UKT64523.1 hypothetical protein LOK61_01795 [Pedobacter mucosus]
MEKLLIFKDGSRMPISEKVANLIRDKFLSARSHDEYILTRGQHGELDLFITLSEIRCIMPSDYEKKVS